MDWQKPRTPRQIENAIIEYLKTRQGPVPVKDVYHGFNPGGLVELEPFIDSLDTVVNVGLVEIDGGSSFTIDGQRIDGEYAMVRLPQHEEDQRGIYQRIKHAAYEFMSGTARILRRVFTT